MKQTLLGINMSTQDWINADENWPDEIINEEGDFYWITTNSEIVYHAELVEIYNDRFVFQTNSGLDFNQGEVVAYVLIEQPDPFILTDA